MNVGQIIRKRREELGLTQDQVAEQAGISKPYLSNVETGKAKNPPSDPILRSLEAILGFRSGELTRLAHLARTPVDVRQEHELLESQVQKLRGILRQLLDHGPRKPCGGIDLDAVHKELSQSDTPGGPQRLAAGVLVPIINSVTAGYPRDFTDLDYPPSIADEYVRCPDLHDPQAFAARVVGDSMEPEYHAGDIVVFSPNTPAKDGDDCFVRFEDGQTNFKRVYQDDEQILRLQPLNSKYPAQTHDRREITGLWPAVLRIQRVLRR